MKKRFPIVICTAFFILALSSCSTVRKLPATVAGASRARFVGVWTLTKISYDGLLPGTVQDIFNQAAPEEFNGSIWNLSNSGNGTYTLTKGTSQTIFWSYNKSNGEVFQFKKLYQGDRAGKVQDGYQLTVGSIDSNHMIFRLPVSLGDKIAYVILSFHKNK
jgi:uncharacterized protein YceK